MRKVDLKGVKFGALMGVRDSETKGRYIFICDCGNCVDVVKSDVVNGKTKSCGCLKSSIISESKKKHGMSGSKNYMIWSSMKGRCYNKHNKRYRFYGGKGVVVCREWLNDYSVFHKWSIDNGYKEGLSIDRVNNCGNYEPSNCRWIDLSKQSENKSSTIRFNINGKSVSLIEECRRLNFSHKLASDRYKRGYCYEDIFSKKDMYREKANILMFTIDGETKNLSEWCKIYPTKYATAWNRIKRMGLSIEEALDMKGKNDERNTRKH